MDNSFAKALNRTGSGIYLLIEVIFAIFVDIIVCVLHINVLLLIMITSSWNAMTDIIVDWNNTKTKQWRTFKTPI